MDDKLDLSGFRDCYSFFLKKRAGADLPDLQGHG
jgi:hypothetical protein